MAAGAAGLPDRGRAVVHGHVPARVPGYRGLARRPARHGADHSGDLVRRTGDWADHAGHALGPLWPARPAGDRHRDLYARQCRVRPGPRPVHPIGAALRRGVRRVGQHGHSARHRARPHGRAGGGAPDVPADAGHGRRPDPGANARRVRARVRILARDLLAHGGLWRDLLRPGLALPARHAADEPPHAARGRQPPPAATPACSGTGCSWPTPSWAVAECSACSPILAARPRC